MSFVKKYLNMQSLKEEVFYILSFASVVLLFLFWGAISALKFNYFAIYQIAEIHQYLFVWLADLLIVSLPIIVLIVKNIYKLKIDQYKHQLDELRQKIGNNIHLAELIGEGKLNHFTEVNDELTDALIALGKNLASTKIKEEELNWVARGKEKVSDIIRSSIKINDLSENVLKTVIDYNNAVQGALYIYENNSLKNTATYAFNRLRYQEQIIPIGKGLVGEAAYEKELIYRTEIPENYCTITSGLLNDKKPKSLLIIPLLQEENIQGVLELAFFDTSLSKAVLSLANELSNVIGQAIYNIKITSKTEALLQESQAMTQTLKQNEAKLYENANEMLLAKEELENSNILLAKQIQEVENAQKRLQALLTNASEVISIYNDKKELVFESPSAKYILGYESEQKVGIDFELLTPKGYKTLNNLFQYLLETPGGEQVAQFTYLKNTGEKLFLETKGKNLLHDPAIKGIILNTQDITERKRAEKEERMKSRMQSLSENSPDMILRVSNTGKLIYTNPAIYNFIGNPDADILKKRINELDIDIRFIELIRQSLSSMRIEPKQIVTEIEMESKSGSCFMEIKAIPEFNEDQELESVLFVAHDLTEMKLIEQEIKEKNKKISDSINYAQRIQSSILPDTELIQQFFPRSFIFYRPKDVVSGDFPWFFEKDGCQYIAAVDCTGHGVPGALLSFIGYFLLNNIVSAEKDLSAAEILEHLHQLVRRTLRQDQQGANGRDGMDLALLKICPSKNQIEFAGAHRPLYYLKNGELIEYKGSRKGIGGIPLANKTEPSFENNVINFEKGDKLFIFSDGLPDQTGGPEGKKYMNKRIRENLTLDSDATMAHFARFFSRDFHDWIGNEKQVDDVLLIGIEM